MGKISDHLLKRLQKSLQDRYVITWYDPDRAFERFVDGLSLEGTRIVRHRDSYFRLRREAEETFARYGWQDGVENLLIYVPAPRLDLRCDVLLGIGKAGAVFDPTLRDVAREALQAVYTSTELEEMLANDRLTLEDLDRLSEPGQTGRGVIPMIFDTTAPHEIAARYLSDPSLAVAVDERGALPDLIRLFADAFGLTAEHGLGHGELQPRLGRHLLLNEFLASLPEGVEVTALSRFPRPATSEQVEACRRAAAYLRTFEPARANYMELARQVQQEYRLNDLKVDVAHLIGVDTFPCAAEAVLAALPGLLAAGWVEEALRLVEGRAASFWVRHDPWLSIRWPAAEMAVKLFREARRVEAEARSRRWEPEDFVRLYARSDGDAGGWCRADTYYRWLEWRVAEAEDDLGLDDLLHLARQAYRQACERLAAGFLAAIEEHGFQFGRVGHQTEVFNPEVVPALAAGPVAYFLVDALRYEMGAELLDRLSEAEDRAIRPVVATPPTITQVGMAALLPGAEKGVAVVEAGGKAAAAVGGRVLAGSVDRAKLLEGAFGETVVDLTLDALLGLVSRPKALAACLAGKRLVVVRSQEIDGIGEQDNVHLAHQVMSRLVFNLGKAVRLLARAGVCRFVIGADHGFLLGEELSEAMKVDPPGGQTVELHRRCWIGRGGAASDRYLRFKAADLGLGGDLEFAFPRGLGGFKVSGGNLAYFHGGLSLQELVVPVITFRLAPAVSPEQADAFTVRVAGDRVTNRIFTVTVRYDQGNLLSPPVRRVRCVGLVGGQEAAFAATAVTGYDPASREVDLRSGEDNHVTLMMQGVEGTGTLTIQLIDAATGAVLVSREIRFNLAL